MDFKSIFSIFCFAVILSTADIYASNYGMDFLKSSFFTKEERNRIEKMLAPNFLVEKNKETLAKRSAQVFDHILVNESNALKQHRQWLKKQKGKWHMIKWPDEELFLRLLSEQMNLSPSKEWEPLKKEGS